MRRRVALSLACLVGLSPGCGGRPRDPALASQAPARTRSSGSDATAGGELSGSTRPTEPRAGDWRARYLDRPAIETRVGRASYYADSLAGRPTASGELYDPSGYTAASRDLPFGTVIRVVRIDTGATVIVRVNDRGPFDSRRRLLDLSRAAAEALGMVRRGVVDVRVEILELGTRRR